jgi:peptide methionine sulfoxide reductase MsrA
MFLGNGRYLFRVRSGVKDTQVGYLVGSNENPTYANYPEHAEGLEIVYDPTFSIDKIYNFKI